MLSSFTLISLIGVMLGVMVLVVVMSVYAGMEREVKNRFLGYSPHILVRHLPGLHGETPALRDWGEISGKLKRDPRVASATPFIADNVIIDVNDWQDTAMFSAVDPEDQAQIRSITEMLDVKNHPESTADMGIDDRVVISSKVAENFLLGVGDTMLLYSTRNFKEVMRVYKANDREPLRGEYAAAWKGTETLAASWKKQGDRFAVPVQTLAAVYHPLEALMEENIREPEKVLLDGLLDALTENEKDEAAGLYLFTAEQKAAIEESVEALNTTDRDRMNAETYKNLEKFVLPKEVTVVGVYQASMMTVTPDIFAPLPLAQDLAGLEDGAVQGISVRLDDPYAATQVALDARAGLGAGWSLLPWNEQEHFVNFSILINQQRVMLSFTLSFIMLVAAFSMMANIFTVTIQKRREIGVMKALGAAPGQIVRVFVYQGMLLGVLGSGLGILLGRVILHFRGSLQELLRSFGADPFSARMIGFDVIPAHHNPVEQILIGVMAFVLCTLAALVPAFLAARSDAAKSLRNL